MNIPLWVWLIAAIVAAAVFVVWCALALASICDDQQEQLLREQQARDALARANRNGHQR